MPYTPPSNRSPASSTSSSPNVSRRSSLQTGTRPSLPRSASYLLKQRRTPSAPPSVGHGSVGTLTPQGTSEDLKSMALDMASMVPANVRQSPPPRTDDRTMPMGAIISPPDSASSGSDDDDESAPTIRGRKLEKLRDAASQIQQQKNSSPRRDKKERAGSSNGSGVHFSFSTSALGDLAKTGRKLGHVRSATEPSIQSLKPGDNSLTGSEEESDPDLEKKPQMVRKKSGELVRPALRPSSRRRPSSMPGTPIFSKAVHFDSHLEHVRHFLQVDRPLAVSAGSSPVDNYDSDAEYPFPANARSSTRSPPYEWEILTSNFPQDSPARKAQPVRLEKVWLSPDQKNLLGSVAVSNLAFQKNVVCRFTLDYWKTTSEIAAQYGHEIRPRETPLGHDRFTFSIKLSDTANLESKTLFFCIRYSVNGHEHWDNNSTRNFQVDFRKKHLPQNGKNGFQGAKSASLPRSNRRQPSNTMPRPKSTPAGFGEFGDDAKLNFDQPIHEYLGESASGSSGLRLKSKSTSNLASDNFAKGLGSPSGLAFSNRYDFGASLTAARKAGSQPPKDKDGLYMKPNVRAKSMSGPATPPPVLAPVQANNGQPVPGSPPTPTLSSSSYEELVNKYCFFGSKQSSPIAKDGTLAHGRFDGGDSGKGSPKPDATHTEVQHAGLATHHTLKAIPIRTPATYSTTPLASPPKISPLTGEGGASLPRASGVRSASPTFAAFDGPTPKETSYQIQQSMMMDRFPWSGDTHAATAIRG
ncbi:putative phosphatase regulatory subunit-domain-containing protein [Mariannaea sp. PMI_226]|nr:putative phosphatase regulatory subunit-domain-containing protein [Mariannaea sp. PMI_226]